LGHDPAVWLAICAIEHSYGTNRDSVLWRNDTRSWTNARTVRDPALTGWSIVTDAVRGSRYVQYADVADSLRDGCYRITDTSYRYVREGRTTIGDVLAIWTEGDSVGYARRAVELMNGWGIGMGSGTGAGAYEQIIPGMVDVRAVLPHRTATAEQRAIAGAFERRELREKRGVVIHYSGPPVTRRDDTLAVLTAEARYHVEKDWDTGAGTVRGDGLMYHVAVGADGTVYLCRDLEAVLWHCGRWPENALALSVHVPIGGEQRATEAQLLALRRVIDAWRAFSGTPLSEIRGHQELQPTTCPGTLMADFVHPYRAGQGQPPTDDGRYFSETGHYVGGGFWRYWSSHGGLPIFGYPLSEELREAGRTVQYFERAVFEWHPENREPYTILLRRVGAEAFERTHGTHGTSGGDSGN
jgi:hypothetical protein